jgi:hypothetical protein
MDLLHYGDNFNLTKEHKLAPNLGWFLFGGSEDLSTLGQENTLERRKTEGCSN